MDDRRRPGGGHDGDARGSLPQGRSAPRTHLARRLAVLMLRSLQGDERHQLRLLRRLVARRRLRSLQGDERRKVANVFGYNLMRCDPSRVMSDPRVKSQVTPPERAVLSVDFAATRRLYNCAGQRGTHSDHTDHVQPSSMQTKVPSLGWLHRSTVLCVSGQLKVGGRHSDPRPCLPLGSLTDCMATEAYQHPQCSGSRPMREGRRLGDHLGTTRDARWRTSPSQPNTMPPPVPPSELPNLLPHRSGGQGVVGSNPAVPTGQQAL